MIIVILFIIPWQLRPMPETLTLMLVASSESSGVIVSSAIWVQTKLVTLNIPLIP